MAKRIAELEKERDEAHGWIARAMMKGCCGEDITKEALQKIIDKRDIEQQAEGACKLIGFLGNVSEEQAREFFESHLRQQAKIEMPPLSNYWY